MKKILLVIFSLLITTILHSTDTTNIDFIKNSGKENDTYIVQGVLTEKFNDDKYTFQDFTGKAKIKVWKSALKEKGFTELPLNTPITLKVNIVKKLFDDTDIKVFNVINVENTKTEKNYHITNILYIKNNAKHDDSFIIEGTIIQRVSNNSYEFQDDSGLTIIDVNHQAFTNANIQKFNDGDKVILKVKINKKFAKEMKVKVYNIIKLT
ncbi:MAG: NirD/YgiW/YdeI family stress tolerance protein [Alphaproteobacteria bacterium]|jgi:uncharacterized protein YdeI (BOF family)|nr:NirD/YgiW/YdeI family stress tolerance protein [Alphaproteobacteria bacterium]